jgi:SET domain-containing protein
MALANFIIGLAGPNDSVYAIKEKFFIYTQEMQALADGSDYHRLFQDIQSLKDRKLELPPEDYKKQLAKLEMEMLSSKLWWSRLTESVVKSLSRIADRESRSMDVKDTKTFNVRDLNRILQDSAKVLLEDKGMKQL